MTTQNHSSKNEAPPSFVEVRSSPEVTLSEKQQFALDCILKGENIFLTGAGGTGKSFLLQTAVQELATKGRRVALTALTGCAALLLGKGAKTIHSWAGMGLGKDPASTIVKNLTRNFKAKARWIMTDTLIIDEVSMMSPEFLEKLDLVAQGVRRNASRFGGVQLILVGDFFQLPPVLKEDKLNPALKQFAFESPAWETLIDRTIQLDVIHRQKDAAFQKILTEARMGKLSQESHSILQERIQDAWKNFEIRPTLLFSRRLEVDHINEENLKALQGPAYTYTVKTEFTNALPEGMMKNSDAVQYAIVRLDNNAPYLPTLVLKRGAQVMLTFNMDTENGLVNGSRGVVIDFVKEAPYYPIVKFKNGTIHPIPPHSWESEELEGLKRAQIPLIPAYAVTIHKCQGATLDSALIDIGTTIFEAGQAYVALSRVRSLDNLYVWDVNPKAFKAHPKVLQFYQALAAN